MLLKYFYSNGKGKFEHWANENGYDTETINEDLNMTDPAECSILEFDRGIFLNREKWRGKIS